MVEEIKKKIRLNVKIPKYLYDEMEEYRNMIPASRTHVVKQAINMWCTWYREKHYEKRKKQLEGR